jgi:hypothetical protein
MKPQFVWSSSCSLDTTLTELQLLWRRTQIYFSELCTVFGAQNGGQVHELNSHNRTLSVRVFSACGHEAVKDLRLRSLFYKSAYICKTLNSLSYIVVCYANGGFRRQNVRKDRFFLKSSVKERESGAIKSLRAKKKLCLCSRKIYKNM